MLLVALAGCQEAEIGSPLSAAVSDREPGAPATEPDTSAAAAKSSSAAEPAGDSSATQAQSKAEPPAEGRTTQTTQKAANTTRGSGRVNDISFDDLVFEMDKEDTFLRSMLTPEIEALNGKEVRIRGWILPTSVFQQTGIQRFILVRDNQECCFGPGAALYDCVAVDMKPGKSATFNIFPVAVEGTFSVREFKGPSGRHLAIYHLEAESVK